MVEEALLGLDFPSPIADGRFSLQIAPMEHASLVAFLSGRLSPEALAAEISNEVTAVKAALRETGTCRIVITAGPRFVVAREGARRLLLAVADRQLPFDAAVHVADCIQGSRDLEFADEATRDAIFFVEDDSREPTREETLNALALLDLAPDGEKYA